MPLLDAQQNGTIPIAELKLQDGRADKDILSAVRNGQFPELSDTDTVAFLNEQFPDLVKRLRTADLSVEAIPTQPNRGGTLSKNGKTGLTPAQFLFEDYNFKTDGEVDRTLIGILALKWALASDRNQFIAGQDFLPGPVRLSSSQFANIEKKLSTLVDTIPYKNENLLALIVALMLGDVGKDRNLQVDLQKWLEKYNPGALHRYNFKSHPDHDLLLWWAVESGMFDSTLNILQDPELISDVKLGIKVGASLNVPQLAQAECPPGSIAAVSAMANRPNAWLLKFLEVLFDVAGAGAAIDARGAIRMIGPVYKGFISTYIALNTVINEGQPLRAGYDAILHERAVLLSSQSSDDLKTSITKSCSFPLLDAKNPHDRALLRILLLSRTATPTLASIFSSALSSLSPSDRARLINGLNVDGTSDGTAILPYYAPGIFDVYFTKLGKAWETSQQVVVLAALMRYLARLLANTRPGRGENNTVIQVQADQVVPGKFPGGKGMGGIDAGDFKERPEDLVKAFDDWEVVFPEDSKLPFPP
ncbi:MAG: hypothetical protein Q9227_005933 [Pyrenula ochraceoflavens]